MKMNNSMYTSHVGYEDSGFSPIRSYFSEDTVNFIQQKVAELLKPDFPQGVIVVCDRIRDVMDAVYRSYQPTIGDIFTRYSIPGDVSGSNMVNDMINQVVSIIVNNVKNTLEMETANNKLDIWDSVLGEGNRLGMRAHSTIKINRKRPPLLFNMNY
jgi:hypothetical protein